MFIFQEFSAYEASKSDVHLISNNVLTSHDQLHGGSLRGYWCFSSCMLGLPAKGLSLSSYWFIGTFASGFACDRILSYGWNQKALSKLGMGFIFFKLDQMD
jgi:hypothetical protein